MSHSWESISDYFRNAVILSTGKRKKDRSGAYSLFFAGSMFSLLGFNYLHKSSLFDKNDYISLREAIELMNRSETPIEIPVEVYGRVLKVLDGDGYSIISKKHIELHTCHFDESSGNWKEQNIPIKESLTGSDFIVADRLGTCVTVQLPSTLSAKWLSLPALKRTQRKSIRKEDQEEFKEEIARSHLTDESAVDMEIIHTEEQLTVNQTVYLRGVLTKKNGSFFLSASNTCKLTLSAKPIEQIKTQSYSNGLLFLLTGIGLLLGGYIRSTYCDVC